MGTGQFYGHLCNENVPKVGLFPHLHLVPYHGLIELVPRCLTRVFLLLYDDGELGSTLQHRSQELVLLCAGDGHNPLHHGLVELVLRHKLKLNLLDPLLESA